MEAENVSLKNSPETRPSEILLKLIAAFGSRGWLGQTIRIKHLERRYRISCTESEFVAYRINENHGGSHGIPGWPVCIVNQNQIVEDAHLVSPGSREPAAHDWWRCIAGGDFEVI